MNRGFWARVLALLLIAVMIVPEFALAESYSAKVYSSSMKVYEKKSTSSKVLGTLKQGTKFTVTSTSGSWAYITYNGKKGYALIKNIISLSHSIKRYTTKTVYVYKTASSGSTKLSKLTADYPLYIVGESGSYYLVDDANGAFTGYVAKSATSTSKTNKYVVASSSKISYKSSTGGTTTCPSACKSTQSYVASTQNVSKLRSYIAYVAECKLGCIYTKSSPNNTTTFSNYSFVSAVMKSLGYSIPGSIKSVGNVSSANKITRSNLKVGDILCFNCDTSDGDTVDHIGIYLGSGYFIHASASAGCVVVSNLNTNYYKKAFCWGRRVIS